MNPMLKVVNLSKRFGGIHAVEKVSFELYKGEILGLVGDNGAGKSTLIKMISGVYIPDEGKIFWKGKKMEINSPRYARELGIETIYQDLSLADNLDVAANIFLGKEILKQFMGGFIGILDKKKMENESGSVLKQLDIEIDYRSMRDPVENLSGGQRQSVAIGKAIYWNAQLVIMDEPTAALGVKERGNALNLVKRLKEERVPVIFISHNLLDIFAVTDRILVMRRGIIAGEEITSEASEDRLVKLMIGIGSKKEITG